MLPLGIRSRSSCIRLKHLQLQCHFSQKASTKPFEKILIANRGEIACRVIKTARRLGVKTVAVYSDADARSKHVSMADEAVYIGGNMSKESYLRADRVLEAALMTGAQAIHPGYGFLSENSSFVGKVEKAGLVFIGPPSSAMDAMGDKIHSKKVAKEAECFVIPGFQGEIRDADDAVEKVKAIGYPVMVKASAGGGGKGMRVAYNEAELREGFALSKSEAASSFGDDRMLLERFIEDPHHIEIQVIADAHGNVAAFPERECSVQRRNQKVVEESPSCLLKPETRKAMQEQAIKLCKAVGYRNAGTVEMLCDGKQNFYFLEMNTRLQVEHPITELVSGEDLVEHMLWVAAGKPLPERLIKNPHLQASGWAIESRVYAEDPLRGFLPSIGPLLTYKEPPQVDGKSDKHSRGITVRIDTGVYEGGVISMYYDPMISKLCTHGPTRAAAIGAMEEALDQYVVRGLVNNLTFLRSVMRNEKFRSGDYNTKFIPEQYASGFKGVELNTTEAKELVAAAATIHVIRSYGGHETNADTSSNDEFVVLLPAGPQGGKPKPYIVAVDIGDDLQVRMAPYIPGMSFDDFEAGKGVHVETISDFEWIDGNPLARMHFKGASHDDKDKDVTRFLQYEGRGPESYKLRYLGSQQEVIVRTVREHELSQYMLPPVVKDTSRFLLCPMPGTLISLSVSPGQKVESGQQLAVVEAMKMQNVLRAPKAATVKSVKVSAGNHLKVDQVIVEFEG